MGLSVFRESKFRFKQASNVDKQARHNQSTTKAPAPSDHHVNGIVKEVGMAESLAAGIQLGCLSPDLRGEDFRVPFFLE